MNSLTNIQELFKDLPFEIKGIGSFIKLNGVTVVAIRGCGGEYEPIHIDWNEIFDYARANNLEDGNVSWHEKGSEEFPKFVGALRKK